MKKPSIKSGFLVVIVFYRKLQEISISNTRVCYKKLQEISLSNTRVCYIPTLPSSLSISSPQPHREPATVDDSRARHRQPLTSLPLHYAFSISGQNPTTVVFHLRFGSDDPTTVPPRAAPVEPPPPPTSPSPVRFS
jgi:hypothetical protein